jgi:SET domain-containing protein
MSLVIRRSKIHNAGCYTKAPIKKGTQIVEYTGPRLTVAEANKKYKKATRTYLFGLDDEKHVIDGEGIAAFINHSCAPNCEPDEIGGRVWIFALRNIKAGEELTYDYSLYDGELDDLSECHCNAKNCRGTMYSDEEMERRAKLLKKRARARKKKAAARKKISHKK